MSGDAWVRFAVAIAGTGLVTAWLAGCAGTDFGVAAATSPPPPPRGAVAEQARLRLIDKCMFEVSSTERLMEKNGPRCQCYARGMLRQMSPAEIEAAAAGSVPSGRASEVAAACASRSSAYAEPRRARRERPAPGGETPKSE